MNSVYKKYVTKRELMQEFGVVRSTMQRYMTMGLPRLRYKGKTYFEREVCLAWFEQHKLDIEGESDENLPEDFLEQMQNEGL